MEKSFEAYYITCFLLSRYEGLHSMLAERDLYVWAYKFTHGKLTMKEFAENIDFLFGLEQKDLDDACKEYEEFIEMEY